MNINSPITNTANVSIIKKIPTKELIYYYKKEIIKSYFITGDTWGVKILYSEEVEPLGTGGAIKKAAKLIDDEDFVVMNGDSFLDVDFNQLITFHKSKQSTTTMGLMYVDSTNRYGRVAIYDKGNVIGFLEKGIEDYTHALHSQITAKNIRDSWKKAIIQKHPILKTIFPPSRS